MADIDGLKAINDTFGHNQGDKLLQHFSRLLNSISRKGDVVARLGGDEFTILLPSTPPPSRSGTSTRGLKEPVKKIISNQSI